MLTRIKNLSLRQIIGLLTGLVAGTITGSVLGYFLLHEIFIMPAFLGTLVAMLMALTGNIEEA